jgi:CheY-like chemotaxis protein
MLSRLGAEVDEAADGATALNQLEQARTGGVPYRLMLLDCRMPEMDGFQVAERAKANGQEGLAVLMLSSDGLKIQLTHAHELGIHAYLVKPIRRADLYQAIEAAMANNATKSEAGVMEPGKATEVALAPASVAKAQPKRSVKILLADDSQDNRLLIHAYLKKTGYLLDDAENGAIAVAMVKAGNYALVLMDVQMPVMDGLEATRIIRAWEQEYALPRLPIFALTASAVEQDVRRAIDAGVDLHLSKPIKKAVLIAAIANVVAALPPIVKPSGDSSRVNAPDFPPQ